MIKLSDKAILDNMDDLQIEIYELKQLAAIAAYLLDDASELHGTGQDSYRAITNLPELHRIDFLLMDLAKRTVLFESHFETVLAGRSIT